MYEMLSSYKDIDEIKNMSYLDLDNFSKEIRSFLIDNISKTGGHVSSNLGIVELNLSLFKAFDFNKDKLIWDVGHQAYVHKILTGRKDCFNKLRKIDGISGFPKRNESKYDFFDTGHSSTSISAALGMARARDLKKQDHEVVVVIGDGALTGGMAYEALNDIGYNNTKMTIILNDNEMSIAENVGGLSTSLSQLRTFPTYNKIKEDINKNLKRSNIGKSVATSVHKIKDSIKQFVIPGMLFEDMGIKYLGPIDGHNIKEMTKILTLARNINGPVLIHVKTIKGKGYKYAEENPSKFHGIGPFNVETGETLEKSSISYSNVFGETIIELAKEDKDIVAVTAAMPDGTGLKNFAKEFPERFFDVGIAEEHAVTMCAGMALEGLKPVFAVYSTFLQRGFDQVLHDVALQKIPMVFAIDRGGVVGADGETHQGIFDLSYLSMIPNMAIMSPKNLGELKNMLRYAFNANSTIAIRYPRGGDNSMVELEPLTSFESGKWEYINRNGSIAILAVGRMVQSAVLVREKLAEVGIEAKIINSCFIKPIDKGIIEELVQSKVNIVTIEDNVIHGGFGSSVLQHVSTMETDIKVLNLGYKDTFVHQGECDELYSLFGLDVEGIFKSIVNFVQGEKYGN